MEYIRGLGIALLPLVVALFASLIDTAINNPAGLNPLPDEFFNVSMPLIFAAFGVCLAAVFSPSGGSGISQELGIALVALFVGFICVLVLSLVLPIAGWNVPDSTSPNWTIYLPNVIAFFVLGFSVKAS